MSRTPLVCLRRALPRLLRHGAGAGQRQTRAPPADPQRHVVDGNGTPASGPKDIVIENNLIADVIPLDPVAARPRIARRPRRPTP